MSYMNCRTSGSSPRSLRCPPRAPRQTVAEGPARNLNTVRAALPPPIQRAIHLGVSLHDAYVVARFGVRDPLREQLGIGAGAGTLNPARDSRLASVVRRQCVRDRLAVA